MIGRVRVWHQMRCAKGIKLSAGSTFDIAQLSSVVGTHGKIGRPKSSLAGLSFAAPLVVASDSDGDEIVPRAARPIISVASPEELPALDNRLLARSLKVSVLGDRWT